MWSPSKSSFSVIPEAVVMLFASDPVLYDSGSSSESFNLAKETNSATH